MEELRNLVEVQNARLVDQISEGQPIFIASVVHFFMAMKVF